MLNTSHIRNTLYILGEEYDKYVASSEPERPIIYSKLGVLELSGWIEEGFDAIARNFVRKQLISDSECDTLENGYDILEKKIDDTHGFTYNSNSRQLLVVAIGTVRLLEIEKELNQDGSLLLLKSELTSLNRQRRLAAHTFIIREMMGSFDAPSVTIDRFLKIEPILQRLWDMA